jgi:riboflavin kinase/FMN adenylyltransferase
VRIWRSIDEVPADTGRAVVTIGNFDGVHLGHQHVIRTAKHTAEDVGAARVVVVTFDPHPLAVLRPELAPPALTTREARLELLEALGVDAVFVLEFTREVAGWPPERFVQSILVDALRARAVVVGANFKFGHRASGDVSTLRETGARHDFDTLAVALDGGPQVWSSTYIRGCLAAGEVERAAEALGRPFAVRGEVVEGDGRGRDLGFPTANVPTAESTATPADGVYAGWLRRLGANPSDRLPAAISVGTNPTFDGDRRRRVESYVLDRDDLELYGAEVEVSFAARLRGMLRFDSADELVDAVRGDVARARRALGVA